MDKSEMSQAQILAELAEVKTDIKHILQWIKTHPMACVTRFNTMDDIVKEHQRRIDGISRKVAGAQGFSAGVRWFGDILRSVIGGLIVLAGILYGGVI